MKKFKLTLSLLMIFVISGMAQSYQKTDLGLKTKINSTDIEIQFYGPSTVRVLKSPEGKRLQRKVYQSLKSLKRQSLLSVSKVMLSR